MKQITLILLIALLPILVQAEDSAVPEGDFSGAARLVFPPVIHALEGLETNVYFDNAYLLLNSALVAPDVISAKGTQQAERWTWTPPAEAVGDQSFRLELRDGNNAIVARASSTLRVSPRKAEQKIEKPVQVLIIGDSLTNAAIYPTRVLELSTEDGIPMNLIGTRGPGSKVSDPPSEVRHEGYGGWTSERFATLYVDPKTIDKNDPDAKPGSPFLFKDNPDDAESVAKLDLVRYCKENNGGQLPDYVTFLLGCNDVFSALDETIEERSSNSIQHLQTLIAMVRTAAPDARIGLIIPVPPAASQDAFGKNYGAGQTRWQYRRNQHYMIERFIEVFSGREKENIELIAAYLSVDSLNGFPSTSEPTNLHVETPLVRQSNGVHPSASGYRQIGDTVYSWLRSHLK